MVNPFVARVLLDDHGGTCAKNAWYKFMQIPFWLAGDEVCKKLQQSNYRFLNVKKHLKVQHTETSYKPLKNKYFGLGNTCCELTMIQITYVTVCMRIVHRNWTDKRAFQHLTPWWFVSPSPWCNLTLCTWGCNCQLLMLFICSTAENS